MRLNLAIVENGLGLTKPDAPYHRACEYDLLLRLEKTAPIVLTKEEEVQVAHLLQRIKIARRKAQEEKIAKYMEQLNKLQTGKIQKVPPAPCSPPVTPFHRLDDASI